MTNSHTLSNKFVLRPIEVTEYERKSSSSRDGMTIAEIAKMMEAGEMMDEPERQGRRTR